MKALKKKFSMIIFLVLTSCFSLDDKKIEGKFDYSKQEKEMANNKMGAVFKKKLYESEDKKKLYYFGGSIYHNYDLFNKSYHLNGYGQVGMEF